MGHGKFEVPATFAGFQVREFEGQDNFLTGKRTAGRKANCATFDTYVGPISFWDDLAVKYSTLPVGSMGTVSGSLRMAKGKPALNPEAFTANVMSGDPAASSNGAGRLRTTPAGFVRLGVLSLLAIASLLVAVVTSSSSAALFKIAGTGSWADGRSVELSYIAESDYVSGDLVDAAGSLHFSAYVPDGVATDFYVLDASDNAQFYAEGMGTISPGPGGFTFGGELAGHLLPLAVTPEPAAVATVSGFASLFLRRHRLPLASSF